ncbi:tetraspanin-5, partial [Quercus suber]
SLSLSHSLTISILIVDSWRSRQRKRVDPAAASSPCSGGSTETGRQFAYPASKGIDSDCCKPPTSCNNNMATAVAQDPDCYHWNNAPDLLCYECDSCKPGVLENVRRDWHKLSVLNIVMFVFLIGIYSIGCCAFRNTKRAELNTLMAKTESNISNPDGITTVKKKERDKVEMVARQKRRALLAKEVLMFSQIQFVFLSALIQMGQTTQLRVVVDPIHDHLWSIIYSKYQQQEQFAKAIEFRLQFAKDMLIQEFVLEGDLFVLEGDSLILISALKQT